MHTPPATLPRPALPRLGNRAALWLQGSILMAFLAASSVPSPLYALYRELWGFSALTLTVVFASYAIALLLALLVFGRLSDHRGRREVIVISLLLEIVAIVLFWTADAVGWLLAARIVQGVATGLATAALSAGLVDLDRARGSLFNSVAPMVGLGFGALLASVLVQHAPAPTRLVFDVLLVVLGLQLLASLFLPETAQRRPGALRSMRPSVAVPPAARETLLRVLPVNTAQWALGGFYFSLAPTLAKIVTGNPAPVVGGLLIAALSLGSASAVAFTLKVDPRKATTAGAWSLLAGVAATLAGMLLPWPAMALAGTLVAGVGFGAAFSGALRSLVPLAQPQERAGLMAVFLAASYLAFSLPAIAAGLLTSHFGLLPTATGYAIGTALLAAATLLPRRRAAAAPLIRARA